ncbi:MAG: glyoxylate/hydroxypyruvate reductase A [Pelatocladus maniniholoensis HA4357-MV3]|uniref:Glyoxylate/hydroxypyruvate reductase A n=1 Tax=Pelatocladus maniniholoensis HA4357-MV3 TaxID=1117104 RepID=A0A9E3H6K6_9NOST|nr:glyoxylate/hydroxypyruvate reductase A [Pelatocladus maniniholoensis HA4357-MV3]
MAVLMLAEIEPTDTWFTELIARLKQHRSNIDWRVWPEVGDPKEIEIVLAWYPPLGTLQMFPNLKLILSLGAGVDHILQDSSLPPDVPIARLVPNKLALQMADYVMQSVLACKCRVIDYRDLQQLRRWNPLFTPNRYQFIVGVLGLGAMGRIVAQRLSTIGLSVRGWSQSPKEIEGIDCFFGNEQFNAFLSKCCVLVNLLPLTTATKGILSHATFAALPQAAYLINVGRGQHLIEADLLKALESGQLAGAYLDVFNTEPLPREHPFWSHPRIVVTPHVAAVGALDDVVDYIIDAIARIETGSPLKNLVDRNQGY